MRITVTGGTGFIGRRLVQSLVEGGHIVRILGRSPKTGVAPQIQFSLWDATIGEPPQETLTETDAVVHLAGEPVAQRWTPDAKRRIRDSRVEGTRRLVDALLKLPQPPGVLVCASAIGYYGSRGEEVLTESSPAGTGFLPDVCREWEAEADRTETAGIRAVRIRIGVVLGTGGGALAQMLPPFKMFVGGQLGSGRQWMSWVHLDDVAGIMRFAIDTPSLRGPVNATSPNPVRNSEFTRVLARTIRRPALFTVPEAALKVLFGEMAEVLLGSQRILPRAAETAGYQFRFPELGPALRNLLS